MMQWQKSDRLNRKMRGSQGFRVKGRMTLVKTQNVVFVKRNIQNNHVGKWQQTQEYIKRCQILPPPIAVVRHRDHVKLREER